MSYSFQADLGLIESVLHGKSMPVKADTFQNYCNLIAGSTMPDLFARIRLCEAILIVNFGTTDTVWHKVLSGVLNKYSKKEFANSEFVTQLVDWFIAFRHEMHNKIMELETNYERAS